MNEISMSPYIAHWAKALQQECWLVKVEIRFKARSTEGLLGRSREAYLEADVRQCRYVVEVFETGDVGQDTRTMLHELGHMRQMIEGRLVRRGAQLVYLGPGDVEADATKQFPSWM